MKVVASILEFGMVLGYKGFFSKWQGTSSIFTRRNRRAGEMIVMQAIKTMGI